MAACSPSVKPARTIPAVRGPLVHEVFGLRVLPRFPLPELRGGRTADSGAVDLELELTTPAEVAGAFSGPADPPAVRSTVLGDGQAYRTERGIGSDYRITYGDRAEFHLAGPGPGVLRCAPADVDEPSWRRFLLDSALGTAALVHGYEALHAGAVATAHGVVAVVAEQGGGKSTLVAQLLRDGGRLVCDDVLCLDHDAAGRVVARPAPALMNLAPTLPDGTPAAAIGEVLATLDGECWVAVDGAVTEPAPVEAVVLLDRGDHPEPVVELIDSTVAVLLPHSLRSGVSVERLARRFEVLADLAGQARLLRASVPRTCPPALVAEALASQLSADATGR